MALAAIKSWVSAEVLYASDLVAEFANIYTNPMSLISPLTANISAGGFDITSIGELAFGDEAANPTATHRWARSGDTLAYRVEDSRTATAINPLAIMATTSGTPAAGIGVGLRFDAESADENPSQFGALQFAASDVTAASEDTYYSILLRIAGAALAERFRFSATGAFLDTITCALTAARTHTLPDRTGTLLAGTAGITGAELVIKASTETLGNSTTLQDDDALFFSLAASETVSVLGIILMDGPAAADLKFAWAVPSGCAGTHATFGLATTAANEEDNVRSNFNATLTTALIIGTGAAATLTVGFIAATIRNSTTAGQATLQWAKNGADAGTSSVFLDSFLLVLRR